MAQPQIQVSESLKNHVESNPHILQVFFTAKGDHYFQTHTLKTKNKTFASKNGKQYGFLKLEPEVIDIQGEKKIYKNNSTPNPAAEIVVTLTREEILK